MMRIIPRMLVRNKILTWMHLTFRMLRSLAHMMIQRIPMLLCRIRMILMLSHRFPRPPIISIVVVVVGAIEVVGCFGLVVLHSLHVVLGSFGVLGFFTPVILVVGFFAEAFVQAGGGGDGVFGLDGLGGELVGEGWAG